MRGLAAQLNVSTPAITRSVDRLEEFNFARRKRDPRDRRSVLIQRAVKGATLLREIRMIVGEATQALEETDVAVQQPKSTEHAG